MDVHLEDDVEDSTVLAFRKAKSTQSSNCPPNIKTNSEPTGICFHPEEDLLAVATFAAEINLFCYNPEENALKKSINHQSHCRELKFSKDGLKLYAVMDDKYMLIYDAEDLQIERAVMAATKGLSSSMCVIDSNIVAIGDDDGVVNLWDKRCQSRALAFEVACDALTSLMIDPSGNTLITTSSDGSMAAVKVRGGKICSKSDFYSSALTCSALVRQDSKLAIGNSEGNVLLFSWGEFETHNDIYKTKGPGISQMIPATEHAVVMGLDNGDVVASHLFPHESIGELGSHAGPVVHLDVCNDGHLMASSSIDKDIMFWNTEFLADYVATSGKRNKRKEPKRYPPTSSRQRTSDFFRDLKEPAP